MSFSSAVSGGMEDSGRRIRFSYFFTNFAV